MNLAHTFAELVPFFARGETSHLASSSPGLALYPRIVRATWHEALASLAPSTMSALAAVFGDERHGLVDAFFDEHPPTPRALEHITDPLARFLVLERGLHPVFAELVDLDAARRAVASHEARLADCTGVNPTIAVRRARYPVVTLARRLARGEPVALPDVEQHETFALVRHPTRHDVVTVTLTTPRLFALARASGEPLPPLDDDGERALARGHAELVRHHVILEDAA